MPQGPAYEIIADFVRSEELWLTKYIESWHIATENGHEDDSLFYLDTTKGLIRHEYTDEEAHDCYSTPDQCSGRSVWSSRNDGPCEFIDVATTTHESN